MATPPSNPPPSVVSPVSTTAPQPLTLSPPAPTTSSPEPNAISPSVTPMNSPQTPSENSPAPLVSQPPAVPPLSTSTPQPPTLSPPAPPPSSPEPNATSPAATPIKSPQAPLPVSPPPEQSITSQPPQPSITLPSPPQNSVALAPPPPSEISPPPLSTKPVPSSATPPKPSAPTTSPLPPSVPLVSSPPSPPLLAVSPSKPTPSLKPLQPEPPASPPPKSFKTLNNSQTPPPTLSPKKSPPPQTKLPNIETPPPPTTSPLPPSVPLVSSPPSPPPLAVSPSKPTPSLKPPLPEPPASPPPKSFKTLNNSQTPPTLSPKKSPPPQTKLPNVETPPPPSSVNIPHPVPPSSPMSSNVSLKLSPPPSPKFSLKVSPPPSVNPTTNASSNLKSTESTGIGTGGTVALVLVLGFILLSLIVTAVCCIRKRKIKFSLMGGDRILVTSLSSSPKSDSALLKMQTYGTHNGSNMDIEVVYSPTESGRFGNSRPCFTYEELVHATNGFSVQNLLGEGGFGCVYKGYLLDGKEIAVKQLNVGGGQGEREFKAEVEIISRVHHRHLVSLVGYCISENQRLLVYEYVPNNNLYFHLQEEGRPVMEWKKRVRVAAGAARGIAYLHEDCHPRIIHRDIKSSNILLDNSFEARVSDFGLAKLALDANTHVTTRVIGTFGYMAPEYASSGMLTEKSDVYSFGVVLLELISGRKPVDPSQPSGNESLVEWARPLLSAALDNGNMKGLADPGLENNYIDHEMFKIVEVAAACVQHAAAKRPRMGQVVREFDRMAASDLNNGMRVGDRETFSSGLKSAEIRFFQRMQASSKDYSTDSYSNSSWNIS